MDLEKILNLNPNSLCNIRYVFKEEWKHCFYQYKNESNYKGKNISEWDEKYNESGWGDLGYDHEKIFDPTQEVYEESYLDFLITSEYSSKTFIKLIQEKINEYKEELEDEEIGILEFIDWLGLSQNDGFIYDLCYVIDCKDLKLISRTDDERYLWFSHYELDVESMEDLVVEENQT